MIKKNYLFLLLIFSGLLLYAITKSPLFLHKIKDVEYKDVNYSSLSSDPKLSAIKTFIETTASPVKETEISFKFNADSYDNWNNIFQTGPWNQGVRLELGPARQLALLLGDGTYNGFRCYIVKEPIEFHHWYNVKIIIDKNKRVITYFDSIKTTDVKDNNINYLISDIAVGTGFNKTRNFKGEIKDFNIKYDYFHASLYIIYPYAFMDLIIGLLCIVVILLYGVISRTKQTLNVEDKLTLISMISVVGFVCAVIYHYRMGSYLGKGYPFNTFLFIPVDKFMDFYHGIFVPFQDIKNLKIPYSNKGYPLPYFPLSLVISIPFALISDWLKCVNIYLITITILFILFVYTTLNKYNNVCRKLTYSIILTITSFPLLFLLDRGNNEGILFAFVAMFAVLFIGKRERLSVFPLAIAIGMKLYPMTLLLLLIKRKKYFLTAAALIISILLTVLALRIMGPIDIVWQEFGKNVELFKKWTMFGPGFLVNNHSLYNLFNYIYITWHFNIDYNKFINNYFLLVSVIFAIISFCILRYNMKIWQIFTLLIFSMLLLPFTSLNYTLITIYVPLMLFIAEETNLRSDLAVGVLFGLLIIPKRYFGIIPDYELDILLNPLIMFIIIGIIIMDSVSSKNNALLNKDIIKE